MDDIERFEVLLVLVLEDVIDLAHPLHWRMVVTFRQSVKVENDVIPFNQRIQQRYQVQQGLSISNQKFQKN